MPGVRNWWTACLVLVSCFCAQCENPRLSACSRKWVKMNDKNYERALDYYHECIGLGLMLEPTARHKYHNNVMVNMKKTCNYFFDRSNLPTAELINVVRKVARILEGVEDKQQLEASSKEGVYSKEKKWAATNSGAINSAEPPVGCQPTQACETTTVETCTDLPPSRAKKLVRLLLWLLFWLLALMVAVQLLFIVWLCCTSSCLCCLNRECTCEDDEQEQGRAAHTQRNAEVYHMIRSQEELSSLSSDDVGSDSEFEVLLSKASLPKTNNRPFFPKFPE